MSIFFYCNWHDRDQWLKEIKKKFKKKTIVTLEDKPDFFKVQYAIIWELPNEVYQKLVNLKLLFSMGAGVDHILDLPSYNKVPIIRLKDPIMGVSTSLLICIFVFLIIGMILGFLQGRKQRREDFSSSINDGNENLLNTNIISQNSLQEADLSDVEEENNSTTDEI